MTDLTKNLRVLGACSDALTWLDDRSLKDGWDTCQRPDWMLWIVRKSKLHDKEASQLLDQLRNSLWQAAAKPTTEEAYQAVEAVRQEFAVMLKTCFDDIERMEAAINELAKLPGSNRRIGHGQ